MNEETPDRSPRRLTHDLRDAFDAVGLDRNGVYELVVDELRRVARATLRSGGMNADANVSHVIGEVWLRMASRTTEPWASRDHFAGWASKVVRSILVDQARAARALKRGGGTEPQPLHDPAEAPGVPAVDMIALDEALRELVELDPKGARIIELCYFGGLSQVEAAALLGIDESTAKRRWRMARGWLRARMADES